MNGQSSIVTRWLPAMAAVAGLLGGIGGAFVGGWVANEGQQQQFRNQRLTEIQDLLIAIYGKYLRTAEVVAADNSILREVRSDDRKAADLAEFSAAEAELRLVADPELRDAARAVRTSVLRGSLSEYRTARDTFSIMANRAINAVDD
jgi:hypothetical protein